jgi:hypothetical protein
MDQFRFDAAVKAFARGTSRRGVIKGTAGAALAGVLALAGRSAGAAPGCRQRGDACSSPEIGTQGRCCAGLRCEGTTAGGGARCIGPNQCECPQGESCINFDCCPNNQICGGVCLDAPCSANACEVCDTQQGACVSKCSGTQTCNTSNGTCDGVACGEKRAECSASAPCCEGLRCQDGRCVGDTDLGERCNRDVCKTGLRCCGNTVEGPGGGVCVDIICKEGFREQGGFPNGPRCECCENGECSTRNIDRIISKP